VRTFDLIAFGVSALRSHKLRTALTVLGVTIGTATLVVSISIGLGVRELIDEQFRKESLRQISVFPSHDGVDDNLDRVPAEILDVKGDMSDAKRDRIRKLRVQQWKRQNVQTQPKPLNQERLELLRQLPHVAEVVPELDEYGRAFLIERGTGTEARVYGAQAQHGRYLERLEVGGPLSSAAADECLVHEYMLYRCGVRDDADVRAIIGKQLRVELTSARRTPLSLLNLFEADMSNLSQEEIAVLEKAWKMLPDLMASIQLPPKEKELLLKAIQRKKPGAQQKKEKTITQTFTIVGVLRAAGKDDKSDNGFLDGPLRDADVVIPRQTAEHFFMQLPQLEENGYSRVRLIVDNQDNLEEVIEGVHRLGLQEYSIGAFVQQMKKNALLIGFAMDFIALVALIVAVLGIMNTMFTTVLERTQEIGILKAIGAKDRQVLLIFLVEGSLIGLLGGVAGVGLGWLASLPGNDYALRILEKQGHHPLPETVFLYPLKLLLAVPVFAILMTTLAALLPARRAARVEPVVALRHE
jgi:putative ABC transport system permease protein